MGRQPRSSNNKAIATVDGINATANNNNTSSSSLPFGDLSKLAQKPPSLPIENDPRHLSLLNRSLFQNDKEIVALEKLHESIRSVKTIILEHFGEEVLLDMVALSDGGISSIAEEKKEYHTILREEFISRMKLRRKLLNRLSRRLLRLSHAMDGNILGGSTLPNVTNMGKAAGIGIFPPALPKYGIDRNFPSDIWDLTTASFTTNPTEQIIEAIKDYMDKQRVIEETIRRTKLRKSGIMKAMDDDITRKDKEEDSKNEINVKNTTPAQDSGIDPDPSTPPLSKKRKETSSEVSDIRKSILEFDPFKFDKDHQADLASIIEYDEEYGKIVNPTDNSIKFATTKEAFESVIKSEESFLDSSKQPLGIGASVRSMSARDKLTEWKRWSNELLSRIPVQPTFEDLGMEKLIFGGLEERKKIARGIPVDIENVVDKAETENKGKTKSKKKKMSDDVEKRKNSIDEAGDTKQQNDTEEEEDKTKPVVVKKQKWFSVQPIPSFRDQDFNTFAMIQTELLNASLQQQSRSKVQEYNDFHSRVYRRSVELNSQKSKLESDLRNAMYAKSLELNRARNEFSNEIAALRAQYNKDCEMFENHKRALIHAKMQSHGHVMDRATLKALTLTDRDIANRCLKGIVDRVSIRVPNHLPPHLSPSLQNAISSKDSTLSDVAMTLAHMVDVASNLVDSCWVPDQRLDEIQADFGPHPIYRMHPSEEAIMARYDKMEYDLREQLSTVIRNLNSSESERAQAWAKLVKARNETDASNTATARKSVTMESTKNSGAPHLSAYSMATRMLPASFVASNAPTVSVPSTSVRGAPAPPKASNPPVPTTVAPMPEPVSQVDAASVLSANSSTVSMPVSNVSYVCMPASNVPLKSVGSDEGSKSEEVDNPVASDTNSDGKQISTFQRLYGTEAVKARMSVDGSIAPVSQTKRTKDGLFVRPAGRQRKNMDWDAINGKWIPLC